MKKLAKERTTRGRPKGTSNDKKSYGILGDLIRKNRLSKKLGLADVAKFCNCSIQFISNIEHGRAPLPWNKTTKIAEILGVSVSEIQSANLTIRSDFNKFIKMNGKKQNNAKIAALTVLDPALIKLIARYKKASEAKKTSFVKNALNMLM